MAVADDERRSDPSGHGPAPGTTDAGHHGDVDTTERAPRSDIDRIADKVKGILRPRH